MRSTGKIVVIGSGLAGLASACTLAARGYSVAVYERSAWLGGKAAVLEAEGFRFDMGPTILIQPSVLRRIFAEAGEKLEAWLPLVRLEPEWRSFFHDGSVLDLHSDLPAMKSELARFSPGSEHGYTDFLHLSEKLHETSKNYFFWRSVDSIWDTFEPSSAVSLSVLKDVAGMRLGQTVTGTVKKFVHDERVAQMLEHFTQYIGSAPSSSPAVLCAIAHMQTCEGVWYPRGGIRAIPEALLRLARKLGVEFHTGAPVKRIIVENGRAAGIELETGLRIDAEAVVSNSDAVRTYDELIGGETSKRFHKQRSNIQPACSGVVLYLGLSKRYEHLQHHNFIFSKNSAEEFDAIYRKGEPAPDPTCYVCSPAVSDPSVAPSRGDALYILVHTPYLRPHHDWKRMLPEYRRVILDKLKRHGGMPDIEQRISFERALTPQDIHERYNVLNGAIYGIASHGRMNGAFKPGNASKLVNDLYLCGGAAHPGPGMPMVMMSGWIAADALDRTGRYTRQEVLAGVGV